MKSRKHRLIALVIFLLLACLTVQAGWAAERTLQLNIPGCTS